jgi:hypothetical protein
VIFGIFALLWAASVWTQFRPLPETAGKWSLAMESLGDPRTTTALIRSADADGHPVGRAYYDPVRRRAVLVGKDLGPAGEGRTLVAWTTTKSSSTARNSGVLSTTPDGVPWILLENAPTKDEVSAFSVSSESDPRIAGADGAHWRGFASFAP